MRLIQFLIDTPVVTFLLLLVLLITVGPVVAQLISKRKLAIHIGSGDDRGRSPATTRFLGNQLDYGILLLGLLLLLALISWVANNFFS